MLRNLIRPISFNSEDAPPPPQEKTLRRLFGYLRPYRGRMVVTLAIYAVCVTITQLYPFVDRKLIDEHIAVGNPDGFLPLLAVAAVFHALNWSGVLARSLLIQRISWSILVDLRRQLFNHVVNLSFRFHEKEPVGKTMTRFIGDANTLNDFLTNQLANVVNDIMSGLIVLTLMFAINPTLTLIALFMLPILTVIGLYMRPRLYNGWERVRENTTKFNIFLAENIAGMRVIQAFTASRPTWATSARPIFMGTVVGAIASGEVPAAGDGDPTGTWTGFLPLVTGALFVAVAAYTAAVFLVRDSGAAGDDDLRDYFARRALAIAVVAGIGAVVGVIALHQDARYIYDGLTSWPGIALVVLSAVCGLAALGLLVTGRSRGLRVAAVGAGTALIWGYFAAAFPYMLPTSLKISDAAGVSATLTEVIVVFGVAAVTVVPSLILLYALSQRSALE